MSILEALGEAAREILERHAYCNDITRGPWCPNCEQAYPCDDKLFADRVIRDLQADTREREARDQQIREHAVEIVNDSICNAANYLGEPCDEDTCSTCDNHAHAAAILALLAKPHTDTTNTGTEGT